MGIAGVHWKQVATGDSWDLLEMPNLYEDDLAEGSRNKLEFILTAPCTPGVAQTIENELVNRGVEGVKVEPFTGSFGLRIYFTKGMPWLAIIVAVVLLLLIGAILIIAWKLFTEYPTAVPILAIGLIVVAALAGIYLVRNK